MKFQIKHEMKGRIRVHFMQKRMTYTPVSYTHLHLQLATDHYFCGEKEVRGFLAVSYTHLKSEPGSSWIPEPYFYCDYEWRASGLGDGAYRQEAYRTYR